MESSIRPDSINTWIEAYVLTDNILQDELFVLGDSRKAKTRASVDSLAVRLKELASELLGDAEAFGKSLPSLLTTDRCHVRDFFFELGRVALDKSGVWHRITAAFLKLPHQDRKYGALSTYIAGVSGEDSQLAEHLLELILQDLELDGDSFELLSNLPRNNRGFDLKWHQAFANDCMPFMNQAQHISSGNIPATNFGN